MIERLTAEDVVAILARTADDLTSRADELRELDAAIGDGDLGITVTIGFGAVREGLEGLRGQDISTIVMRSGMAFNRKAASTFGALYATMCMRAAQAVRGVEALGTEEVAAMARAAADGVRERGKSEVGDKTLLDALVPAADALERAAEAGEALGRALAQAVEAAREGVAATAAMKSRVGRASWFSDRTEGIQDPGATAVYYMVRSLSEYVNGSS